MSDVVQFHQLRKTSDTSVRSEAGEAIADIKLSDLYAPQTKSIPSDSAYGDAGATIEFLQQPSSMPTFVTGWDNQELADLYRTQRILSLAGISTKVDQGVTDEGDPWFVFMDSQNEVFVHFSRFDGFYIVTSQTQEKPIRGNSLQDLVSEFSKRVTPVKEASRMGQNVVSISGHSRNVVLIHPAAAIAALVWSIYLMSDDLVAAVPMIEAREADGALLAEMPIDVQELSNDLDVLPEVAHKALKVLSDPTVTKQFVDPVTNRDAAGPTMTSGIAAKSLGLGLSLVALSVGLPIIDSGTLDLDNHGETDQLSIQSLYKLLIEAKEEALSVAGTGIITPENQTDLIFQVSDKTSEKLHGEVNVSSLEVGGSNEIVTIINVINSSYPADPAGFYQVKPQVEYSSLQRAEPEPHNEGAKAAPEDISPRQAAATVVPRVGTDGSDLLQRFDAAFDSFKLVELEELAQSDLAELLSVDDTIKTQEPTTTIVKDTIVKEPQYDAFDQEARMFLDFLVRTYTNIKIVNLDTEIIFIHMDAFDSIDHGGQIYSKSWSFDDGGTISTIGLKSDMMLHLDLIA